MSRKQRRATSKWDPKRLGYAGGNLKQSAGPGPVAMLGVTCAGEPAGSCMALLLIPLGLDAEGLRVAAEAAGGALALSGSPEIEGPFYSLLCSKCAARLLGVVGQPVLVEDADTGAAEPEPLRDPAPGELLPWDPPDAEGRHVCLMRTRTGVLCAGYVTPVHTVYYYELQALGELVTPEQARALQSGGRLWTTSLEEAKSAVEAKLRQWLQEHV